MKTIKVKVYSINELSETAKNRALSDLSDINTFYDWYLCTYEDAENIGLKISGFKLDRGEDITGEFILSANEVAENIFKDHGEKCETYQTALNFIKEWQPVYNEYMNEDSEKYESIESEEELIYIESEFLKDLLNDYLKILQKEWEYLTSEEALTETINVNEYTFLECGKMFNV